MSKIIEALEKQQLRDAPKIEIGNTVKVNFKIVEGDKERVQPYEGVVIAKHGGVNNPKSTFTVRRVNQGFGIERVFPLHSPRIDSVVVTKRGRVRRAKLYFLRDRVGKAARLKEKLYRR